MNNVWITPVTFLLFTGAVALLTYLITRRDERRTNEGYFLAGRSLTYPFIAASLLLTNLSTEQMVGLNGDAFSYGLSVMAWEVVAVVALVAMYESPQSLPLERMYGKNLTFKTGGVDATHCSTLLSLIAAGRLDPSFLITHRAPLNDIMRGYDVFEHHKEGCIKWAVTPYEAR